MSTENLKCPLCNNMIFIHYSQEWVSNYNALMKLWFSILFSWFFLTNFTNFKEWHIFIVFFYKLHPFCLSSQALHQITDSLTFFIACCSFEIDSHVLRQS